VKLRRLRVDHSRGYRRKNAKAHVNVLVNVNVNVPGAKTNVIVYVHVNGHVRVLSSTIRPVVGVASLPKSRRYIAPSL
jgi:hypothetical protein